MEFESFRHMDSVKARYTRYIPLFVPYMSFDELKFLFLTLYGYEEGWLLFFMKLASV